MLIVEELFFDIFLFGKFGEDIQQKLMGLVVDFILLLLFKDGLVDSKVTVESAN